MCYRRGNSVHPIFFSLALALSLGAAHAATTTWASTNFGPYKSTDGGASWQLVRVTVSNPLLQGIPDTVAIALDPSDSNKIYLLAAVGGTSGAFKSTDGGQNWTAVLLPGVGVGSGTQANYWMAIDPVVTSTLYIEAANRVLRSTDSGATWTSLASIAGIAGVVGTIGLAIDPNRSGVVYVTSGGGAINKSTDFGDTWTQLRLNATLSPTIGGIFVDPINSQRLYVARIFGQGCAENRVAVDCNFFKSVDGGLTWSRVASPGSGRSITFDRVTGDIYAGGNQPGVGSAVLKSSDQGVSWTPLLKNAGGINDGPWVSADPLAAGNIYSVGDTNVGGEVRKTVDGGATWKTVALPPLCTGPTSAACPLSSQERPRVNGLTYVLPPRPVGAVTATLSAASRQAGPVAPESIVMATGSHLATGSATGDLDQPPVTLAGTTVNVTDSAGIVRAALLFSVSATQVVYQVPAGTAAGEATVTITAGDGIAASAKVQIAPVAPGLYTINSAGLARGYALRLSNGNLFIEDVFNIDANGATVARPITVSNGDQVTLIVYGTGFRAGGGDFSATIGGTSAPVLYAGPQGVQPGLDQFNVMIPPELGTGSPQEVQIIWTAGGLSANTVSITLQ